MSYKEYITSYAQAGPLFKELEPICQNDDLSGFKSFLKIKHNHYQIKRESLFEIICDLKPQNIMNYLAVKNQENSIQKALPSSLKKVSLNVEPEWTQELFKIASNNGLEHKEIVGFLLFNENSVFPQASENYFKAVEDSLNFIKPEYFAFLMNYPETRKAFIDNQEKFLFSLLRAIDKQEEMMGTMKALFDNVEMKHHHRELLITMRDVCIEEHEVYLLYPLLKKYYKKHLDLLDGVTIGIKGMDFILKQMRVERAKIELEKELKPSSMTEKIKKIKI